MASTKISVNVSFEFYYWLENAAKSQDRRMAELLREALEEYRERRSLEPPPMTDAALEQMNAVVASLMEQDRVAAEKAANG